MPGDPTPHPPRTYDEEIIRDASPRVEVTQTDDQRIARMETEVRKGFAALSGIGRAACVFGSARTPEGDPEYEHARAVGRALGEAGLTVITGGGPGAM